MVAKTEEERNALIGERESPAIVWTAPQGPEASRPEARGKAESGPRQGGIQRPNGQSANCALRGRIMKPLPNGKRLLNAAEAAEYLGMAEGTIRGWASQGRLPKVKIGGNALRFDVHDLELLIKSNRYPARNLD